MVHRGLCAGDHCPVQHQPHHFLKTNVLRHGSNQAGNRGQWTITTTRQALSLAAMFHAAGGCMALMCFGTSLSACSGKALFMQGHSCKYWATAGPCQACLAKPVPNATHGMLVEQHSLTANAGLYACLHPSARQLHEHAVERQPGLSSKHVGQSVTPAVHYSAS